MFTINMMSIDPPLLCRSHVDLPIVAGNFLKSTPEQCVNTLLRFLQRNATVLAGTG